MCARKKIKAKKHNFDVRKRTFASKIPEKFIEVYTLINNDYEFVQNFQIQYAPQKKIFEIFDRVTR